MIRSELKPADYIVILKRRWVPVLVLTLIGGPLGYGIAHFLPPKYSSQTTVLIQQPTVPQTLVPPVVTGGVEQRLASMKAQILSRSRLEPVIRQFGIYSSEINTTPMEDLVARLQKAVDVSAIRPMEGTSGSSLPGFNVTVTLSSPQKAQSVCTAITSMFIAENERTRREHSEDTTQFLSQQLADAKAKLDDQNAKLAAFKTRYLGSLPDDDKTNLNILTGLTAQLNAATEALSRAQQDKSFLESSLSQAVDAWQATQNGNNPLNLQQQLVQAQNHLADLQTRYTDSYPDVVRAKADIAALKKQIADQENNTASATPGKSAPGTLEPDNIQRLRAQVHSVDVLIKEKTAEQEDLKRQIKVYEARVQSTPDIEQQYKALTLGYNAALDNYNELAKNRDQAQMATELEKRQEGETFAILDPANLPDSPSFPNRWLFLGGGFVGGLALGIGLAFLKEKRDTSLRTEQDVEFALRLPVIAMIPAIGPLAGGKPVKFVPRFGDGQGISETLNS